VDVTRPLATPAALVAPLKVGVVPRPPTPAALAVGPATITPAALLAMLDAGALMAAPAGLLGLPGATRVGPVAPVLLGALLAVPVVWAVVVPLPAAGGRVLPPVAPEALAVLAAGAEPT